MSSSWRSESRSSPDSLQWPLAPGLPPDTGWEKGDYDSGERLRDDELLQPQVTKLWYSHLTSCHLTTLQKTENVIINQRAIAFKGALISNSHRQDKIFLFLSFFFFLSLSEICTFTLREAKLQRVPRLSEPIWCSWKQILERMWEEARLPRSPLAKTFQRPRRGGKNAPINSRTVQRAVCRC